MIYYDPKNDSKTVKTYALSFTTTMFEESDPRLLLEIPPNTNSSSFYLQKLLEAQVSYNDSFNRK